MKKFFPAVVAFGLSYGLSTLSSAMSNSQSIKSEDQAASVRPDRKTKGNGLSKDAISKLFLDEDKHTN